MKVINKNYKLAVIMAVAMVAGFGSCSNNEVEDDNCNVMVSSCQTKQFKGTVRAVFTDTGGDVSDFDSYGMLIPSFTPQQLKDDGFEYGDLLNVQIGDSIFLKDVPFVTGFNEVGVFETCFCDYNALNTVYGFGQLHGNFRERIGGTPGDTITVTLAKKQGYKDTWEIMKSVYTYDRNDYPMESDEQFANFREVTTSGMGAGVLYRSSNPLNLKDNAVRYAYVDSLARHYGINTEIDLADTDAKIEEYMQTAGYKSTYCPQLFKDGHVVALGLTADTYGAAFMQQLGNGLKFMLNNEPPYLLHCNEGKDRCGFVSMLLEALAGATYEEVAADYMLTLVNFYKIEKGGSSYQMRQCLSVDRLVWLLANVNNVTDFSSIDWSDKDPSKVNLQKAAEDYVQACGLTAQQCKQLQEKLRSSQTK